MSANLDAVTARAEETREKFRALLDKTNKENPKSSDVSALAKLLSDNVTLPKIRTIEK